MYCKHCDIWALNDLYKKKKEKRWGYWCCRNAGDGGKDVGTKEEGVSTESDEEEKKEGGGDAGDKKRFKMPSKKFEWNDDIR